MTIEKSLAWEERQEESYDFVGFRPVAVNGSTLAHEVIGQWSRIKLDNRLTGSRCRVLGPSMKIEVAGHIPYPYALVFCASPDRKTRVPRQRID